jgi:hypothetical protein
MLKRLNTATLFNRKIYHTKFGLQNHTTSMEASNMTLSLKRLKKVHVKVSNFGKREIALLGFLFKTTTITLPRHFQYSHKQSFLRQLLCLKRLCEASVYIVEKYEDCH